MYNIYNNDLSNAITSVTNKAPTLSWGATSTVAVVGSTNITLTMPANPNSDTTYTFATGDSNGQIKVTPSGGSAQNVSVKGLGSAAYTASTNYAAASHTHSYLPLSGGTINGSITASTYYFKYATNDYITMSGSWMNLYCGTGGIAYKGSYHDFKTAGDQWNSISASNFVTQSSRRYKTNIESIKDDDAKKILDINVVKFDYIDGMRAETREQYNQHGVIAEEVEEIIPEVVNLRSLNEDEEAVPDSVDYSKFVPYLIKMVQIQQKEINELKK